MLTNPWSNSRRLVGERERVSDDVSEEVAEVRSTTVEEPEGSVAPRREPFASGSRPAASATAREETPALVFTPGATRAPTVKCQREGGAASTSSTAIGSSARAPSVSATPASAGSL